jgi:hypothetical protein
MEKRARIGFCGDVYSECPRFIATQHNSNEELETVAELWFRLGYRDRIVNPKLRNRSERNERTIVLVGLTPI